MILITVIKVPTYGIIPNKFNTTIPIKPINNGLLSFFINFVHIIYPNKYPVNILDNHIARTYKINNKMAKGTQNTIVNNNMKITGINIKESVPNPNIENKFKIFKSLLLFSIFLNNFGATKYNAKKITKIPPKL